MVFDARSRQIKSNSVLCLVNSNLNSVVTLITLKLKANEENRHERYQ